MLIIILKFIPFCREMSLMKRFVSLTLCINNSASIFFIYLNGLAIHII